MKLRNTKTIAFAGILSAALLSAAACGDDGADAGTELMFVEAPPTTLTVDTAVDVSWMVHAHGELHHTEIRACMGHSTDCGLGGADSFDKNFAATMEGEVYTASVSIDAAGPWTIAVFAHVDEDPHISNVIHTTVE